MQRPRRELNGQLPLPVRTEAGRRTQAAAAWPRHATPASQPPSAAHKGRRCGSPPLPTHQARDPRHQLLIVLFKGVLRRLAQPRLDHLLREQLPRLRAAVGRRGGGWSAESSRGGCSSSGGKEAARTAGRRVAAVGCAAAAGEQARRLQSRSAATQAPLTITSRSVGGAAGARAAAIVQTLVSAWIGAGASSVSSNNSASGSKAIKKEEEEAATELGRRVWRPPVSTQSWPPMASVAAPAFSKAIIFHIATFADRSGMVQLCRGFPPAGARLLACPPCQEHRSVCLEYHKSATACPIGLRPHPPTSPNAAAAAAACRSARRRPAPAPVGKQQLGPTPGIPAAPSSHGSSVWQRRQQR